MGDYVIYVNEKCVITACDNTAFIKKLDCIAPLMADAETGCAYQGAKEGYILDFSDATQSERNNLHPLGRTAFPKEKKE